MKLNASLLSLTAIAVALAFTALPAGMALFLAGLVLAIAAPAQVARQKVMQIAVPFLTAFAVVCYQKAGLLACGAAVFVSMAIIAGPSAIGALGAAPDTNAVATGLNLTTILDAALTGFKRAILPLRMFSTLLGNVKLSGNNTVDVPYYPLQGIDSKDFSSSYSFSTGAGSNTGTRQVTLNKRKYQPLQATSSEIARTPRLDLIKIGMMKGEKLGYDIVQDVLSVVTAANFGPAAFTGASSGFDSDDVIDLGTYVNKNAITSVTDGVTTNTSTTVTSATAFFTDDDIGVTISGTNIPASTTIVSVTNTTTVVISAAATGSGTGITFTLGRAPQPWPQVGRGLLINEDYNGALMKDTAVKAAYAQGSDTVIKDGVLPRVLGFDYAHSPAIPGNSENLVGMAVYQSAILFAQAPIPPADPTNVVNYQVVEDPETGIVIEYREWFDPSSDTLKRVIEANYGYAKGEQKALKRLVSA